MDKENINNEYNTINEHGNVSTENISIIESILIPLHSIIIELEKTLIAQSIKLKYLEPELYELIKDGQRVDEYMDYRRNINEEDVLKEEIDEEHQNDNKLINLNE